MVWEIDSIDIAWWNVPNTKQHFYYINNTIVSSNEKILKQEHPFRQLSILPLVLLLQLYLYTAGSYC